MPPSGSPADGPDVVVVAVSARALAASARRAGRRPAAIDLFADTDTRALAHPCLRLPATGLGIDTGKLLEALDQPALRGLPLVYGAGFEDDPVRLARVALDRPLLGNAPLTVARCKNPFLFAETLDHLGIPHPAVAAAVEEPAEGWLLKRAGGSGGDHVGPARGTRAPSGFYFQRRVGGTPVSIQFLGNGRRSAVLGFARPWVSAAPGAPYRHGGIAGPARLPRGLETILRDVADALAGGLGLVGLNSADLMVDGGAFHLLEVNPRPGASLDLFDRPPLPPLFALHLKACAGRLPDRLPALAGCRATAVLYAAAPLGVGPAFRWPDWTADRPHGPARIAAGHPVATVLADGAATASARRAAVRRLDELTAALSLETTA
ncbi:ATP-grasp domain-containing protein [Azospirillum sp. RWY-5-1]|uniref:ATP-grasp domain-containing protein n=1 Tax=Azospirillum oleiclasticum TaxID=2735135 RepID=A0ABX2TFR1_9PROT|nr:ATP-grasp domain-containing protein [Azospirillum oleiclasticum]NYZ14473.1 ATP-grasp domain-containing protein [Azospirillum oleiclasticum]NYZ23175.1 ATP-grasp domain-containing protein [Azospirillum oleiclasticum]